MRFYTVEENGQLLTAVSLDGGQTVWRMRDLGYTYTDMTELILNVPQEQLRIPISENVSPIDLTKMKLMAPIPYPRQDVICLGLNYREHATEAGGFSEEAFGGENFYSIYFSKRVNRAAAPGESISSYQGYVDSLDYEVELGVILGKDAKAVKAEEAQKYIFGYTIINDISARNLQTRHKQWYLGKSLDGFTPMGPCIVTKEELKNPDNLSITSYVNGQNRQDSNTKYLIRDIPHIIEDLSQGMTLLAGTIIATGTPAGVGMGMQPPVFLKPGDEVVCEIENIGKLITRII